LRTFHQGGASRSWWTKRGGFFGSTTFRSVSRNARSATLNITAFVVPWFVPIGIALHIASTRDGARAVAPRSAATSSRRVCRAISVLGSPGTTRPAT
jgi:hypothetical protein